MNLDVDRLLQIGIALSKEKDHNRLLDIILTETMHITQCDAGTLYLCSSDFLHFCVMRNNTMRVYKSGEEQIGLPPVPMDRRNVCACAALDRALINIADVRQSGRYDFSGPIRYDAITGYTTKSMLVVPLEDNYGDIIGVLQLINATAPSGETISFDETYETVISALASEAAVCATNMRYIQDIKELFQSFTHVMSAAIDQRTPYNANHTHNMEIYAGRFINYINAEYEAGRSERHFNQNRRDQFLMSVRLHDVGKLVIPLEIMDKDTRLSGKLPPLRRRFDVIVLQNRIDRLEGRIGEEECARREEEIRSALSLIERVNGCGCVGDAEIAALEVIGEKRFIDVDGEEKLWVTPEELRCLKVRRGTLTAEERQIVQSHAEITGRLLSQIRFYPEFSEVPRWAQNHHEFIDGTGYPHKLCEGQIDFETRLLTIIDIYDALTAHDRPYRRSMGVERAIAVLQSMVDEGKLDGEVLRLFRQSRAWEVPACGD